MIHLSCDDFLIPLQVVAHENPPKIHLVRKHRSIFNYPVFRFLKELHDTYDITYSCYLWYENADRSFNLSMIPDSFSEDFMENSSWLKFGFHGYHPATNLSHTTANQASDQYNMVISQIIRFTGSASCVDRVPRLHNYAGNLESVSALRRAACGIIGLLTAEDGRTNYYHNRAQTAHLLNFDRLIDHENDLVFFSTDLRLDNTANPKSVLESRLVDPRFRDRMNDLIIFQHDPNIAHRDHQSRVVDVCEFALEHGYRFSFPMNDMK